MQLQRSCGVSGVGGKAASGRAARVACPQQRLQHKRAASAAPASNAQQWRQHAAARGALVTAAAAAQQQQQAGGAGDDDGEIDPMTGQVVARTSALSPVAGFELEAGGLRWAYRRAEVDAAAAAAAVAAGDALPDVLLLHGLGSSSYSFRRTLALLGAAGVNAVAPDWPGHGDSAKPAPGGGGGGAFDYSEAAFVAALDAFVAAADLRKPLALVVQGSVLPQYALLWAAGRPDLVERLVVLNTPLSPRAQLRPELVRAPPMKKGSTCASSWEAGRGPSGALLCVLLLHTGAATRIIIPLTTPPHPLSSFLLKQQRQPTTTNDQGGVQEPDPLPAAQGGREPRARRAQGGS